MNFWGYVTGIGDAKMMLPAAAIITFWLCHLRNWNLAARWVTLFTLACALVVVTKLAFIGWGVGIRALDFTGISGHAMRSAAVIPVFVYLAFQNFVGLLKKTVVGLGYFLSIMVGVSRVILDAHSPSEVIAGSTLGLVVSTDFILRASAFDLIHVSKAAYFAGIILLFSTITLDPAPTKIWLKDIGLYLSGRIEPIKRYDTTW